MLALVMGGGCAWAAAPAAPPERPNILFIIFDDWGGAGQSTGYSNPWIRTPGFDRVAREGVRFDNAFTSNPKCSPCRASILTGRNTWQLKEAVSHNGYFPAGFVVFPDLLERSGYFIGLTGKGWGPGDFETLAGFKRNPAGPSFDTRTHKPPNKGINANDYAGNFEDFLSKRPKDKPFFFWMGFREPHRPYEPGSGRKFGIHPEDVRVPAYLPDTPVVREDLADYAREVEWADSHVLRALELLEKAGQLDNTLVIVTSDHGMPFPYVKGQIVEEAFHIPLAMRWGKTIKAGRTVADFINVRDFAPTFLELARVPVHSQMTGSSLSAILRSPESGWIENRDEMLVGKERHDIGRPHDLGYPVRALRTREFLYVCNFRPERWPAGNPETDFGNVDPSPSKSLLEAIGGHYYELAFGKRPADQLFRITDDPGCVDNLAADPVYAATVRQMRERMMRLLHEEGDPRVTDQAAVFDTYKYVGGRAKGYETWLAKQAAGKLAPKSGSDAEKQ